MLEGGLRNSSMITCSLRIPVPSLHTYSSGSAPQSELQSLGKPLPSGRLSGSDSEMTKQHEREKVSAPYARAAPPHSCY